jgi:hypothetical protein
LLVQFPPEANVALAPLDGPLKVTETPDLAFP